MYMRVTMHTIINFYGQGKRFSCDIHTLFYLKINSQLQIAVREIL
jgi:hypothetical protein